MLFGLMLLSVLRSTLLVLKCHLAPFHKSLGIFEKKRKERRYKRQRGSSFSACVHFFPPLLPLRLHPKLRSCAHSTSPASHRLSKEIAFSLFQPLQPFERNLFTPKKEGKPGKKTSIRKRTHKADAGEKERKEEREKEEGNARRKEGEYIGKHQ